MLRRGGERREDAFVSCGGALRSVCIAAVWSCHVASTRARNATTSGVASAYERTAGARQAPPHAARLRGTHRQRRQLRAHVRVHLRHQLAVQPCAQLVQHQVLAALRGGGGWRERQPRRAC